MSKYLFRIFSIVVLISILSFPSCNVVSETTKAEGSQDLTEATDAPPDTDLGEFRDVSFIGKGEMNAMKFNSLPLGQVQAQSWLKNQLLLQAENMTAPFETLSPDCKSEGDDRSGWLGGSGESWERGTYYVRGLIATAYVLDDAELKEQAQKWIDWTLESQTESGAFGPYANDMGKFDPWPVMPMLIALEMYCDATNDERVIPFLQAYFAWEAEYLKSKPLTSWAKQRGGDNITAVLWLYERTGDNALLDLCNTLYNQTFDWEGAYTEEALLASYHIVNLQESFKLFPVMYAVTGDEKYLDVYYTGIENLYMASGRQDGMSNGDELSRGIDSVYGSETCAVVERMLCDEISLCIIKDAKIADHLENIAYNALPQQLLADGKGQVYFTIQNQVMANLGSHGFSSDGGDRLVYGLPGGYPCCIHNYQMGWPMFVASMWMGTSDNGIAVGAYGPCSVSTTVGNGTAVTVKEETNYPYEDTVTLTVTADKTDTYPIYIRVPEWCNAPSVTVNGHAMECELVAGEYIGLTANWKDGDVITLNFPSEIKATITDNNSVSVRKGAVLFALEIQESWKKIKRNPNDWDLPKDYPSYNITPASDWNYALENFDFEQVESNFTVKTNPISDDMRFELDCVPIVLEAKAREILDWNYNTDNDVAADIPVSPVEQDRLGDETITVRLVPYSHTRLRIALMPWTGEAQYPQCTRPEEDTLLFESVVVPMEDKFASLGTPILNYTVQLEYDAPEDIEFDIEINRKNAATVKFTKGKGAVSVETDLLRTYLHNRIALTTKDGSAISEELNVRLSVNIENEGAARYEAEDAKLTGSAYKATVHVAGIDDPGSSLTFETVPVVTAGDYTLRFYYAAPMGRATHTIFVDGIKCATVVYNENGKSLGWGSFSSDIYADVHITLTEGVHKIRIGKTKTDVGFAELDAFDLLPCSMTGGKPEQ